MLIKTRSLLPLFALALLPACATPPPEQARTEPRMPNPGRDGVYTVDWPDPRPSEIRTIVLDIGPDIADVCRLPKTHFEFDSSEPLPQGHLALRAVADCLRSPELEKAKIHLVGRADPRGTPGYNRDLAQRRAERVKAILVKEGIPEDRITTRSTGESEAVGAQPMYSYGFDRRVDIVLLGVVHAPR